MIVQQNAFISIDTKALLPIIFSITAASLLLSIQLITEPILLRKRTSRQTITVDTKSPEYPGNMTLADPDRAIQEGGSYPNDLRYDAGADIDLIIPRPTDSHKEARNGTVSEKKASLKSLPPNNKINRVNIGFIQAVESHTQTQTGSLKRSSCGKSWKTPLNEITGKIRKIEYKSPPWTNQRGLHLDVETAPQNHIVIHVFPEKLISQCSNLFMFEEGEEIMVSGSEFLTGREGRRQNLCAATITRNSNTLELRNPETGDLVKQACCREICKRNCAGKSPICGNTCLNICGKMKPFLGAPPH
ncbi:MAG: hypothetical protein D3924_05680 [Candidatus Electrothrix sp. AR4]|nr:hypothetical protein [Candidatus Electrothrix sp. AR4]